MKNKVAWSLPLMTSLLVSAITCLLMPLSMYDSNPSEFPMTAYSEVLFYSGVLTILVAAFAFLVLLAVRRWIPKLLLPAIGLLLGLSIALYAQGNLIGADYGALDGHVIQWELMHTIAIVNTLIWIACILIPVLMAFFSRKIAAKCFGIVVPIILAYVILLSIMLFVANIPAFNHKKPAKFTLDKFMELSSERNLVVIILDSFDRAIFDRLLDEDPSWRDRFRGFTYYHNTVSAYCYTVLALPQIVSGYGKPEDDLTIWQYQRKAYCEAPFLKTAKELGFVVDAYYDENVCPLEEELAGFGWFGNAIKNAPDFFSTDNIRHFASLFACSTFRYLPHLAKRWQYERQGDFREKNGFDIFKNMFALKVELNLSKRLANEVFTLIPEKKIKIYHCSSIHIPMFCLERAKDNLEMACRFIDKTREAGIYDKTDFVIMADHGSINRCRPLFMCPNGTDEFKVSEMPFSYRHLCEAFTDSLYERAIRPIQAVSSEMVPIIDDPRRAKMDIVVDEKHFDGIGTEFSDNALELLATSAEMDVVMTDCGAKLTWNGKTAMLGLPVEKALQGGNLSVIIKFDKKIPDGQSFAVQYSDNKTWNAECSIVPGSDHMDVSVKLPDMPKDADMRYAKLLLYEWAGQDPPSIINVRIENVE